MDFDPQAKVLIVSALEQRSVLKTAFKAGAADFVAKPFDKQNLRDSLEQLLAPKTP
jgi:two-component system chemotaxis response regulator CheY